MRRHGTPIGGKAQAQAAAPWRATPSGPPMAASGGGGGGKKGGKGSSKKG